MGRYKQCLETKLESHNNKIEQKIANLESKNEKRWANIDDSMNGLIKALNSINFNNKVNMIIMTILLGIIILKS